MCIACSELEQIYLGGDVVFIGQTLALIVKLAEIPPIEPGTMETGRTMTTAAAWRAAATAALPAPVPADG